MECDICGGTGYFQIHDKYGIERYRIDCPECHGDGVINAPPEARGDQPDSDPPIPNSATPQGA